MLFTLQACSDWKHHHGNHIEERIGLVNYSTIGRNCDQSSRNAYYDWDQLKGERKLFCKMIEDTFPHLEASIGGEISIDIEDEHTVYNVKNWKETYKILGEVK